MPIVTSENAMRRLLDFLIYLLIGAALSLAIVAYAYETDPLPGRVTWLSSVIVGKTRFMTCRTVQALMCSCRRLWGAFSNLWQ